MAPSPRPALRFNPSLFHLATGAARINARQFSKEFDAGIPFDESNANSDVLLLYGGKNSLPAGALSEPSLVTTVLETNGKGVPLLPAGQATRNCDLLYVVHVQQPNSALAAQCVALTTHHADSAIHAKAFMRVGQRAGYNHLHGKLNRTTEPLRPVGHGVRADDGTDMFPPPDESHTAFHYEMLKQYLNHRTTILKNVRSIVSRIATSDKTVAAVATNRGYAHLLANFVCHARARGIDLRHVLVFATDQETKDLAEGLGLAAYYEEKLFGTLPAQSAGEFGDATWNKVVYVQGLCAQILTALGYNFVFQDVDVFWYRDPLEYFRNQTSNDVDIFFMEDGGRGRIYAPYGANTGFYYVRANRRTRHLFTNFLGISDNLMGRNDQSIMNMMLQLHSTQYGLTIKTISRTEPLFVGGYHFNVDQEMMRKVLTGQVHPYTYHAHWAMNPREKLEQLHQLGMWHLNDRCANATAALSHISDLPKLPAAFLGTALLARHCCSEEPIFQCHYRDFPSKEPCKNSPKKYQNFPDFWPSSEP